MKVEIRQATLAQEKRAKEIYITKYNELRLNKHENGFIPRPKLMELMRELGAWDDQLQEKMDSLKSKMADLLSPLQEGGISLSEMKERAQKAQVIRSQLGVLNGIISNYDNDFTFESHADDAKMQYLIMVCSYNEETGERLFNSKEEYENYEDADVILDATTKMYEMVYGNLKDMYRGMPENEFLIEYGFLDDDLKSTEKVEEVKRKPFLDADGNPVVINKEPVTN